MSAKRSASQARRGRCPQISMPGTLVRIGRNSPRYSDGASGLRSNVSMWLGLPQSHRTIIDFALRSEPGRPADGPARAAGRARGYRVLPSLRGRRLVARECLGNDSVSSFECLLSSSHARSTSHIVRPAVLRNQALVEACGAAPSEGSSCVFRVPSGNRRC